MGQDLESERRWHGAAERIPCPEGPATGYCSRSLRHLKVLDKGWYTARMDRGDWERAKADPTWMICAVCARVLDKFNDAKTGEVEWRHPFDVRLKGEDHPVWPVPASQIAIETKCDFCFEENPQWIQPARSFGIAALNIIPGLVEKEGEHGSHGDWAACDTCADFLNRGDWRGLRRRALNAYMARNWEADGMPKGESREQTEQMTDLMLNAFYSQLRRNLTGPVRRVLANEYSKAFYDESQGRRPYWEESE